MGREQRGREWGRQRKRHREAEVKDGGLRGVGQRLRGQQEWAAAGPRAVAAAVAASQRRRAQCGGRLQRGGQRKGLQALAALHGATGSSWLAGGCGRGGDSGTD